MSNEAATPVEISISSEKEIEVTPEMVSVGLMALEDHLVEESLTPLAKPRVVLDIFLAMCKAATQRKSS